MALRAGWLRRLLRHLCDTRDVPALQRAICHHGLSQLPSLVRSRRLVQLSWIASSSSSPAACCSPAAWLGSARCWWWTPD